MIRSGMHILFALEYTHNLVARPTRDLNKNTTMLKKNTTMLKKNKNAPILVTIEELTTSLKASEMTKTVKPVTKEAIEGITSVINHGIASKTWYKNTHNQ